MKLTAHINTVAWVIRRKAARTHNCKVMDVVWRDCLILAQRYVRLRTQCVNATVANFCEGLSGAPTHLVSNFKAIVVDRIYNDQKIHIKTLHAASRYTAGQWRSMIVNSTFGDVPADVKNLYYTFKRIANTVQTKRTAL